MRKLSTFILLILAFGCSTNSGDERTANSETTTLEQANVSPEPSNEPEPEKKIETDETLEPEPIDSAFAQYLEMIPELTLPYETGCGSYYPNYPEIPDSINIKYSRWDLYFPYRRFPTTGNFQLVMYLAPADIELPIFYTYTNRGDTIATKQMFFGYCGGEPGYYHKEHFRLDEQMILIHFDSTWRHEVDEDYNEIEGTETFEAVTTNFKINADGEFIELDN